MGKKSFVSAALTLSVMFGVAAWGTHETEQTFKGTISDARGDRDAATGKYSNVKLTVDQFNTRGVFTLDDAQVAQYLKHDDKQNAVEVTYRASNFQRIMDALGESGSYRYDNKVTGRAVGLKFQ
jgi:hypothetical protein